MHSMGALPPHMLQPVGAAAGATSLTAVRGLLTSFPGPLTLQTQRDKVRQLGGTVWCWLAQGRVGAVRCGDGTCLLPGLNLLD